MEFFPAFALIFFLGLACISFVFAVGYEKFTTNQSIVLGFISIVSISIILIFLFAGLGGWALFWLVAALCLALSIFYQLQ